MATAIWNGAVSFGLVSVPVKLYSAVHSKAVRFRQLAPAGDGGGYARVKQKRVASDTGEEVAYEDLVKGYEIAPDRYVVVDPDELAALDPEARRTIDIHDFVDLTAIDPVFFDRPYYLAPAGDAAVKPYRLLADAMAASGKVAIATFVMRSRQYLAALRATDSALMLSTMHYADEVVPAHTVEGLEATADVETSDRELDMARQLVESLTADFEPERYEDTYRQRVLELVEKKAAGEEVVTPPAAEDEAAEVVDLMAALEESLHAARKRSSERAG